jgi:hypothetical protein
VFPATRINIAFMALRPGNFVCSKKKTIKFVPLVISFCSQVMLQKNILFSKVNLPENRMTEWSTSNLKEGSDSKLKRIDLILTKCYVVK